MHNNLVMGVTFKEIRFVCWWSKKCMPGFNKVYNHNEIIMGFLENHQDTNWSLKMVVSHYLYIVRISKGCSSSWNALQNL